MGRCPSTDVADGAGGSVVEGVFRTRIPPSTHHNELANLACGSALHFKLLLMLKTN